MKIAILAAAALFAAACTPMPSTDAPMDGPDAAPPTQSADATACAARGGEMRQVGRMQSWQCVVTYADAGKACTDGDQCQGDCRIESTPFPKDGAAVTGQCQANSQPFGCHATVEDGKATPALCVD